MFNPAEASAHIKDYYIDYLSTSFPIADKDCSRLFKQELTCTESVSKGPYIDIQNVFTSGVCIMDLCEKGVLSQLFSQLEAEKPEDTLHKKKLPLTRPLYLHQQKAIEVITTRQANAVITTGTGSGKTECFLIPVINELLREKEAGKLTAGVRAILIYPMNALANDQMKRLRELLMYYPDITFGVYNGETKTKQKEAEELYEELHIDEPCRELRTPLKNELISREVMNETPPHILCTNYAMLEHMLLRPENDALFVNSNFKYIVLDEAHTYAGATGMETALLLRRLKARIRTDSKVQFILTSATLGKKDEAETDIICFAENLCQTHFSKEDIVFGTREEKCFTDPVNNAPIELFESLCEADNEAYSEIYQMYGQSYDREKSQEENLYSLCENSRFYRKMRTDIFEPTSIKHFAEKLSLTEKQVISFIHVCTLASHNGKALIDARYHFFIRALEGMYSSLAGEKKVFLDRKKTAMDNGKSVTVFERAVCPNCGDLGIVGKIDRLGLCDRIVLAPLYDKDDKDTRYFHVGLFSEGFEEVDTEDGEWDCTEEEFEKTREQVAARKKFLEYRLCPICGAISEKEDGDPRCGCNSQTIFISEYSNSGKKCLKCQSARYRRFYIGSEAATGVLATELFEELPVKTITEKTDDGTQIVFEGGKQFLAFSDSRSDAAYFASYMSRSYKEFLRRRGVLHVLNKLEKDLLEEPMCIEDFVDEVRKYFLKNDSFSMSLNDPSVTQKEKKRRASENAWMAVLTELINARRRSNLVSLGKMKFEYRGNTPKIVAAIADKYGLEKNVCKELLDHLAMSFAYFGALETGDDVLEPENRKYVFYTSNQKYVALQKTSASDRYSMGWLARNREGKPDSFYPNSRVKLVASFLGGSESKANRFLEDYFYQLSCGNNPYRIRFSENGSGYCMPVNNYMIRVHGDENAHWYRCRKCGKISVFAPNGSCTENGCDGHCEEFDPEQAFADNHYLNLYSKEGMRTMLIREHTAQLSREEALRYQSDFEKNHIHALSCSTTFEMGVDVGELETVFLRNMPPTAANYAQRAGRAGRSRNAAAYALTYAKLSSHDFTFFSEPNSMIAGNIQPPMFKTDNEKIVLRHIFAVTFSFFFKRLPEFFDNNKAEAFLENNGYERFTDMVKDPPQELQEILNASIPNLNRYDWQEKLIGENGILTNAIGEYRKNTEEMQSVIDKYYQEHNAKSAVGMEKAMNRYRSQQMIDFLVRNNILPKYGFPIDTVELDVSNNGTANNGLQLSRDLKMAISEYAPGEKVIANDKMYTSRFLKKSFFHGKMDYYISYVCECDCGTWNYRLNSPEDTDENVECVVCRKPLVKNRWRQAIEPRGGFVAEWEAEDVPLSRPDRIYRSQDSYIGNGITVQSSVYEINGRTLTLSSGENDSIMVTSQVPFYVCKKCGRAYGTHDVIKKKDGKKDVRAEKDRSKHSVYITVNDSHRNSFGSICGGDVYTRFDLNHIYKTDVVLMDFGEFNADQKTMRSVLYALLYAMASTLSIDINDLGGCLRGVYDMQKKQLGYSLALFDTVAGGAGHVRRLLNEVNLEKVLQEAYRRMEKCNCDTSCFNCLRSYSNQRYHEDLDRHCAAAFLKGFLGRVIKQEGKNNNEAEAFESTPLILSGNGLPVKGESIPYIFSLLTCEATQKDALIKIWTEKHLAKPDLNEADFKAGEAAGYADLVWKHEKIILFSEENLDSYLIAQHSDYTCFYANSDFNTESFSKLFY